LGNGITISVTVRTEQLKLNYSFQFKNLSVKLINYLVDSFNIHIIMFYSHTRVLYKNLFEIVDGIVLSNLQVDDYWSNIFVLFYQ